jgi:phage-related tail fiber protein
VDNAIAGLSWKDSVRCASTANLGLTGLAAVDGVTPAANDRVLVKNQSAPAQNGIYLAQSGAWTRALDADAANELEGMAVFVNEGTTNADTSWVCTANAPITVGTTLLPFSQFQGSGTYNAGAGLVQNANAFDVVAGDTSLTVSADAVIVNTTVIATRTYVDTAVTGLTKKFAAALTGTVAYATGEVVTHNLNTRDVHVMVVNGNSPWAAIEVDWEATTVNTVTIRYNPNIGAGYRAVVIG